ncbi:MULTISPECIES: GNAT family N-acetyltransferase [Aestuariimicrobium]|uniref:GNAT family N-acetyltransferase n=1 Tax=Aestuariimicrobium TaxID=396388 RepID=UPI0003B4622B|nr:MULTISPECIES: GNAT family N-acetyltransferase [Aestuariimicrobium]CAI9400194.1 N-acetyltransferase Eis [Aestuariimicrobium sp. T2.26MG-19.2B]
MAITVRPLTDDDAEATQLLRHEAFGSPLSKKNTAQISKPPSYWLGAFDDDRQVGRAGVRDISSFWGGTELATAGVMSVTTAQEHRGRGVLSPLLLQALADARERGAVVATLFPTANAIYRRFGFELAAELTRVKVPTIELGTLTPPEGVTLGRATEDDVPALDDLYHRWAIQQNGPVNRTGPLYESKPAKRVKAHTGITVARIDGQVAAYASWNRGHGYGEGAELSVREFVSLSSLATQALLAMFGTNSPVLPHTVFRTSGDDGLRLVHPAATWHVVERFPYMVKVLNLRAALVPRVWPEGLDCELPFRVTDDSIDTITGDWKLRLEDGHATVTRIGRLGAHSKRLNPVEFSQRGLSLLFSGSQSMWNIVGAGLAAGGATNTYPTWSAAFGGRQNHIRDYF